MLLKANTNVITKRTAAILMLGISLGFGLGNIMPIDQEKYQNEEPRVVGIGGIFFKTPDSGKTRAWYAKHLGFKTNQYGTVFQWRKDDDQKEKGFLQWSAFGPNSEYFEGDYMINYRVHNLEGLLSKLRKQGVDVVDSLESYDYGKFIHIRDLNGTKIELWEPVDSAFAKYTGEAVTK